MVTRETWIRGAKNGLNTTWELGKVIVPVYIFVVFLQHTLIIDWIADKLEPVMGMIGLPGEASLVLVLGKVLNLYAAIGAIMSLSFTAKEITIIAVILSLSHSLPVESAVGAKTGVSPLYITVLRIGISIIAGVVLNIIL
ncbi:MAG: nucleoside recognition domain-containing protein [Bacillota bacterium]|nr:nucleoside recognition domain-containing protein [Bacillota bacterium]